MQKEKFEAFDTQRRVTLVTFLTLLFAVTATALWMIGPYLLAVTMGGILALLSYPIFIRLQAYHFKSKTSGLLATLGVILLVVLPIVFFVTVVIKQGIVIGQEITQNGALSFHYLIEKMSRWGPIRSVIGSPEVLERQARSLVQSVARIMTGGILGIAAQVPNILLQLALASIACFFFLVDGRVFLAWMSNKIPLDADVRFRVVSSFKDTAISVIWATLAAATAQSLVILLGYLVLGVPAAFLAGGATFIFAWIPIVGSTPVWLAGAIYLYSKNLMIKTVIMLVIGIIASLIDNFVRPLVLKGRSKLHPLVSLVAIFGGIGMFGIMGVFIGPILAAVVISLFQIWPAVGQRFGLLPQPRSLEEIKKLGSR